MRHLVVDFNRKSEQGNVILPVSGVPYGVGEKALLSDFDGNTVQGQLLLERVPGLVDVWVAELDMDTWRDGESPGVKILEEEVPLSDSIQAPDVEQCVTDAKHYCGSCGEELTVTEATCGECIREENYGLDNLESVMAQVGTMFDTAQPSDKQRATMKKTREDAKLLAAKMISRGGTNACTKLALRKLQEAVMYANRAVLELG